MKSPGISSTTNTEASSIVSALFMAVVFVGVLAFPDLAMAQAGDDGTLSEGKVKNFFANVNSLLNIASIAVVTIAVIFAGYQIAFAHKRIADVAPVLIGGFLIGAAAQIAKMLLGTDSNLSTTTMLMMNALPTFYA